MHPKGKEIIANSWMRFDVTPIALEIRLVECSKKLKRWGSYINREFVPHIRKQRSAIAEANNQHPPAKL